MSSAWKHICSSPSEVGRLKLTSRIYCTSLGDMRLKYEQLESVEGKQTLLNSVVPTCMITSGTSIASFP